MAKDKSTAHVIWKRPDGFHGASPDDFYVADIETSYRIWLHKKNIENYPFRVAGGWEEELSTKRLNRLINHVTKSESELLRELSNQFDQLSNNDSKQFFEQLMKWLNELKSNIKGDKWEVEVVDLSLKSLINKLEKLRTGFLSQNP